LKRLKEDPDYKNPKGKNQEFRFGGMVLTRGQEVFPKRFGRTHILWNKMPMLANAMMEYQRAQRLLR